MGRSRADEILREWSVVSNTAQRPLEAPRGRVSRGAGALGFAAAGAVVILIVALVVPQLTSNNPIIGASQSPSASARPSATSARTPAVSCAGLTGGIPCADPLAALQPELARRGIAAVSIDIADGAWCIAKPDCVKPEMSGRIAHATVVDTTGKTWLFDLVLPADENGNPIPDNHNWVVARYIDPNATPTPEPSTTAGPTGPTAKLAATIDGCTFQMRRSVFADGRLYAQCFGNDKAFVAAIDVAAGKIVARYDANYGLIAVAGGALWVSDPIGDVCPDPCAPDFNVKRIDLATGKVTTEVKDRFVVGEAGGFMVVARQNPQGPFAAAVDPALGLEKLDLATGAVVGHVPWRWSVAMAGAGSLWGFDFSYTSATVPLTEVNATTAKTLATFQVPSNPDLDPGVVEVSGRRFVVTTGNNATVQQFVELGASKVESVSPTFSPQVFLTPGGFYALDGKALSKLDPGTWQPTATFMLPDALIVKIAGDTIWIDLGTDTNNVNHIAKLDLQP